jgi:hypothetical protein
MTAATTAYSMFTRVGQAALAVTAAALIACPGTANAASLPVPASSTAPSGQAASMCLPAQVAAATCLDYAIGPGGDPWASAVTDEMAQPGGTAIAARFVAARGEHFHDAEQAKLKVLIKDGAHPDGHFSSAYNYQGVGTAAKGGAHWEEQSYGKWGPCGDNGCSVYEKVTFTYTIATHKYWDMEAKYKSTYGHRYVVSHWDCDLRLDQGRTSKHLASWSICQEKSGAGSNGVIEESSTITTGDQRNWQFGKFTFELGLTDAPYGLIIPISFQSKRWYVEGKGGQFH